MVKVADKNALNIKQQLNQKSTSFAYIKNNTDLAV